MLKHCCKYYEERLIFIDVNNYNNFGKKYILPYVKVFQERLSQLIYLEIARNVMCFLMNITLPDKIFRRDTTGTFFQPIPYSLILFQISSQQCVLKHGI